MKTTFYLVVSRLGNVIARKNRPNLQVGQLPVKVTLTIPDALFDGIVPTISINLPGQISIPEILVEAEDVTTDGAGVQSPAEEDWPDGDEQFRYTPTPLSRNAWSE